MCYKGYFIPYYNKNLDEISISLITFHQTKVFNYSGYSALVELTKRNPITILSTNFELAGQTIKKYLV